MRFVYILLAFLCFTMQSYAEDPCKLFVKSFIEQSQSNANVESYKGYLSKVVDVQFITKFSLGANWKSLTSEQRKSFHNVYSQYIISKYAVNFTKYPIQSYSITSSKNDERRPNICNIIVNINTIVDGQEKSYPLTATIKQGDVFYIQDITFENVSLLQTHKQEVSSLLQSKGFDGTIQALKDKIR